MDTPDHSSHGQF